eukprot:10371446-Alexandrium_andersonii.AAC.1
MSQQSLWRSDIELKGRPWLILEKEHPPSFLHVRVLRGKPSAVRFVGRGYMGKDNWASAPPAAFN